MSPNDETRARKVEQVRGLLRKAGGTDHEAERAAFEAKAAELITRWAIEEAELGDADQRSFESKGLDLPVIYGVQMRNACMLLAEILDVFGGTVVFELVEGREPFSGQVPERAYIHARPSTIEPAIDLFDHLFRQMTRDALNTADGIPGGVSQSVLNDWGLGWIRAVGARLREAQTRAVEITGAGLILHPDAAKASLADEIGHQPTEINMDADNLGAAYLGELRGRDVDLGQTKLTSEGTTT